MTHERTPHQHAVREAKKAVRKLQARIAGIALTYGVCPEDKDARRTQVKLVSELDCALDNLSACRKSLFAARREG